MRMAIAFCLAVLVLMLSAASLEAQVSKGDFWKVKLVEPQELTVAAGDIILVKSRTFPLIPANLKKTFEVSFDHSRFRTIAEEPPQGEGGMGKSYYFVPTEKGESQITVTIKEEGRVVDQVTLKVTCR